MLFLRNDTTIWIKVHWWFHTILQLSSGREKPNCSNFNYSVVLMKNNKRLHLCLTYLLEIRYCFINKLYNYHSSWDAEGKPDACVKKVNWGPNTYTNIIHFYPSRSCIFLVGRSIALQWKAHHLLFRSWLSCLLNMGPWASYWTSLSLTSLNYKIGIILLEIILFRSITVMTVGSLAKYLFHILTD